MQVWLTGAGHTAAQVPHNPFSWVSCQHWPEQSVNQSGTTVLMPSQLSLDVFLNSPSPLQRTQLCSYCVESFKQQKKRKRKKRTRQSECCFCFHHQRTLSDFRLLPLLLVEPQQHGMAAGLETGRVDWMHVILSKGPAAFKDQQNCYLLLKLSSHGWRWKSLL